MPWGWRCLGEVGGPPPAPASAYRAALAAGDPPSLGCFGITLHQTALYDFVSTLVLMGVLLALARRPANTGFLALVFTTWYGSMRVMDDFLRVDRRYFGLTGSQILAAVVVGVSVVLLLRYRGAPPRAAPPSAADGDRPTTERHHEGDAPGGSEYPA
jgi:prolipoprotein diacylglyceryltransferase